MLECECVKEPETLLHSHSWIFITLGYALFLFNGPLPLSYGSVAHCEGKPRVVSRVLRWHI